MGLVLAWLVALIVFAALEAATTAFFALFLAIGSAAAAVATLLGADLVVQGIVFAAASILGIVAVRPMLTRRFGRTAPVLDGAPDMIGRTVTVVEAIGGEDAPGHVLVSGENWPAITVDGTALAQGTRVTIVALRQATLVVAAASPVATGVSPSGPVP